MKRIKTLFIWSLISLALQFACWSFVEFKVSSVLSGAQYNRSSERIEEITATLPDDLVVNPQLSFSNRYLAYLNRGDLKIIDLKTSKIVFSQKGSSIGKIVVFNWLPDRNVMLFLSQQRNVDQGSLLNTVDLDESNRPKAKSTVVVKGITPDIKVESMGFSTFSNMTYILTSTENDQTIYTIDVMKHVREQRFHQGKIIRYVTSEKKGTLYLQTLISGTMQIISIKDDGPAIVLTGNQFILLGVLSDRVLVGEIHNNVLSKIIVFLDTQNSENSIDTDDFWTGNIPWEDYHVKVASNQSIIFYNKSKVIILSDSNSRVFPLDENNKYYLTENGLGLFLIEPREDHTTQFTLKPITSF